MNRAFCSLRTILLTVTAGAVGVCRGIFLGMLLLSPLPGLAQSSGKSLKDLLGDIKKGVNSAAKGSGNDSPFQLGAGGGTLVRTEDEIATLRPTLAVSRASSPTAVFVDREGRAMGLGKNLNGMLGQGKLERQGSGGVSSYTAPDGPFLEPVELVPDAAAVFTGNTATWVVNKTGEVWGVGNGGNATLGTSTIGTVPIPAKLEGMPPILKLAVHDQYILALAVDGSVWCWGSCASLSSKLFSERAPKAAVPTRFPVAGNVRDLALCAGGSYLIMEQGEIIESFHSRRVASPVGAVRFLGGDSYNCFALASDGSVLAWGNKNRMGNGGSGKALNFDEKSVTVVPELKGVKKIVISSSLLIGVTDDGRVLGWGGNALGFSGMDDFARPLESFPKEIADIDAHLHSAFVLTSSGRVLIRGLDWYGRRLPPPARFFVAFPIETKPSAPAATKPAK